MDITDITSFKVKCPSPPGIFQTWPLDLCPGVGWRSLSSANWMRFIQQFRTDRGGNGITVRDATEATQVKQRVLKVVRICRDWSYYWSLKYHRLYTVEKVIYIYVYPYTHSLNIQHINTPIYIHTSMNESFKNRHVLHEVIHTSRRASPVNFRNGRRRMTPEILWGLPEPRYGRFRFRWCWKMFQFQWTDLFGSVVVFLGRYPYSYKML